MKYCRILGILLLVFGVMGGGVSLFGQAAPSQKATEALNNLSDAFEALVEHVGPAVVQVFSVGYAPGDAQTTGSIITRQRSSGSGVIVNPSGYIITNAHVIEGALQVKVLLANRAKEDPRMSSILKPLEPRIGARVVGVDRETDLAVLKIERENLPYLRLGDSDLLRQGQVVLAFGSPLGLENSVTMGVISAVARQLEPESPMVYIQTDAPINPGNSGGPLVDTEGRIVGINTLIFSQSGGNEGVGFAAPVNIVRTVYNHIRKNGRVQRGEIGVLVQTITPVIATGLRLSQNWGVIVADVEPAGPAGMAGLLPGDIVTTLDGKLMENARQFEVNLYRRGVGDRVRLQVIRGEKQLEISVDVAERDDDPNRFLNMVTPKDNLVPKLGILAIDINREVEQMLPRLRKRYGVLVAAIAGDTPATYGGLQPGDIIYELNQREITGLTSLKTALEPLVAGDAVVIQVQRRGRLLYAAMEIEP